LQLNLIAYELNVFISRERERGAQSGAE
jgi:hypothetical protein